MSSPTTSEPANGLVTMVDFSGDTVLVTATVGVNPYYLILNNSGTTGYTLNSDKTVNSFDISPSLISSQVLQSTLPAGIESGEPFGDDYFDVHLGPRSTVAVDQMTGTPPALEAGIAGAPRVHADLYGWTSRARRGPMRSARRSNGGPGQVQAIETAAAIRFRPRCRWAAVRCTA